MIKTAAVMLGVLSALLWSARADACAACSAGDPTISSMGEERPAQGRARVGLALRGWGHHVAQGAEGHSHTHSHETLGQAAEPLAHEHGAFEPTLLELRLDLSASHAVTDWLVLGASLPIQGRQLGFGASPERALGLGDADLGARFVLSQGSSENESAHVFSALVGVELPTAPMQRDAAGVARSLDLQTGSGSVDPRAGVSYGVFAFPWSAHASAVATVPTEGFGRFRAGPSLELSVAGQYQPLPNLALRLGADARAQGNDEQRGALLAGSGGTISYVTPGVLFMPTSSLALHLQAFVPLLRQGGPSTELPTVGLGALYDF